MTNTRLKSLAYEYKKKFVVGYMFFAENYEKIETLYKK